MSQISETRRLNRILDALGYTVEAVDRNVLKHRHQRVCRLGFHLLNTYGYGDTILDTDGERERLPRARKVHKIIARHPNEFMLGFVEGLGACGTTYDDDPYSPRSQAYDLGRTLGELYDVADEI